MFFLRLPIDLNLHNSNLSRFSFSGGRIEISGGQHLFEPPGSVLSRFRSRVGERTFWVGRLTHAHPLKKSLLHKKLRKLLIHFFQTYIDVSQLALETENERTAGRHFFLLCCNLRIKRQWQLSKHESNQLSTSLLTWKLSFERKTLLKRSVVANHWSTKILRWNNIHFPCFKLSFNDSISTRITSSISSGSFFLIERKEKKK